MFEEMIRGWFRDYTPAYNGFVNALLKGNLREMNRYMNRVALNTFSFFDSGNRPSEAKEPERFYHGFAAKTMPLFWNLRFMTRRTVRRRWKIRYGQRWSRLKA